MATRFAFWRKIEEDSLAEKHAQPGLLSDFILGSQDGLVNVLGVILGVAIASYRYPNPIAIILAGGLAAAFAESISMGHVAYTSTVARRHHYAAGVESKDDRRSTDAKRPSDGDPRRRVRNRGLRQRVPRQRRSRRVDARTRRPAFRPRSRSAHRNLFKPRRIRPLSRGASLGWLGHSLAKAIRRVQIPRTALLSTLRSSRRDASRRLHGTRTRSRNCGPMLLSGRRK